MKTNTGTKMMSVCLMAVVLMAAGKITTALAAPPPLQGQILPRALTPNDKNIYSLPNAQGASGLLAVGVGQPAYLEALVNVAIAPSNILSVTWTLTSKPIGSSAVLLPSPLSTNVPTYKSADRYQSGVPYDQVAWPGGRDTGNATNNGRSLLLPDVTGQYTVTASIVTAGGSGSTNLTLNITAGTYLGAQTCALCHSGGVGAEDIYHPWSQTPHATFFARAIDGQEASYYNKSCISCHTVGYDTAATAINGGFDDLATQYGWTFPLVLTNGNWASMQANYPQVAALANIQCENCHGPGSEHAYALGNTNVSNWPRLGLSYAAPDCAQCHDDPAYHYKSTEWNVSLHAAASRTPSGASRPQCVRCHTAAGFTGWAKAGGMAALNAYPTNIIWADYKSTNIVAYTGVAPAYTSPANPPDTSFEAISCAACHDPHNDSQPHQLRLGYNVTLSDGTVVTNAGSGGFCMECHNNRDGSYTNMMAKFPFSQPNWAGGSAFGTHDSPQADILEGVNAETYGTVIPSAAHANVISNTCVGCHMQPVASTDPAFLKAGGHTFKMSYNVTNSGVVTEVPLTAVCSQCHGKVTSFDMPVADYNGDGVIEGVQTEVQHLLDKLSTLLPPKVYHSNPNDYVADGLIKTTDSQMAVYTNVPAKFLKAYYNWDIVFRDGSLGVHNAPFVVGLLKASIGDLTGDANGDGLPDSWQIANFGAGFATNPLAGPNAVSPSNGLPNWLNYALGLDPHGTSTTLPNGVVYVNDNTIGGTNNAIAIYTAAEVVFDTGVGTNYQIQAISNLGGGWQNVGGVLAGTGSSMSYLTPTRSNAQQFYRVVHTP